MEVYREILPESYLLILTDDARPATDALPLLRAALRRAAHSGKPSVWIDCGNLPDLPVAVAEVLLRYGHKLAAHGIILVLCHVSAECEERLLTRCPDLAPLVVPTLLDAQQYCRQRVNRLRVRPALAAAGAAARRVRG